MEKSRAGHRTGCALGYFRLNSSFDMVSVMKHHFAPSRVSILAEGSKWTVSGL